MTANLNGKGASWWAKNLFHSPTWRAAGERFANGENHAAISMFCWGSAPILPGRWNDIFNSTAKPEEIEEARSFVRWLLRGDLEDKGEKEE